MSKAPQLTVNAALVSGHVYNAGGTGCTNAATDQSLQTDLQAQVATRKKDLNVVQFYPIISVGIAYNFKIARQTGTRKETSRCAKLFSDCFGQSDHSCSLVRKAS